MRTPYQIFIQYVNEFMDADACPFPVPAHTDSLFSQDLDLEKSQG